MRSLVLLVLALVCVKPLDTQTVSPVVHVQTSIYPNNVLRIAEYQSNGSINVELSEVVRDNQVEITCQTASSGPGISKISFKKITIPVGRKDGAVSFDVVSPGHVVEVQCGGQSVGGSQFLRATSIGNPGYILVTKRPTVSICSNVVVVPTPPALYHVQVLFSENITSDPVNVTCSVLSPVKARSDPVVLKFITTTAPVMSSKVKVRYQLVSESGDAVIVGCQAASLSTSTPAANLQYTLASSQGQTAVFTFQVPMANFVPAAITSLGWTTVGRTISYLVLEKPAENLTEFQCLMTVHGSVSDPASLCSSASRTVETNVELTSVIVNLVTTNMTFEVGDYFKPLVVQVNGSTTTRDQRLIDVTCCRKHVKPKYFVLATTISLWIDVFPSIQFTWSNVSETTTETSYPKFDPQCPCDLTAARCDVACCCDLDCVAYEKQAFSCITGLFGGASREEAFEYGCQETWSSHDKYLALLCVVTDNNPFLGLLHEFPFSLASDSVKFDSLKAMMQTSPYEYGESESRLFDDSDDVITNGYREGMIVKTDLGYLTLPQEIASGACARYAPVAFLRNMDTWCSGEFSESMCTSTSLWSAINYLVPSTFRQQCETSPQVLSVNNRDNSTKVPTSVAYFCAYDPSGFTSTVQIDWAASVNNRSFFSPAWGTGNESLDVKSCSFDDGMSKAPAPRFNASLDTCFNVVLRVEYDIYWRATQIVQVRAKITMGDVRTTTSTSKLFVAQRFSVKFIHLMDIDRRQLPFIERLVEERSGNPGYLIGKKVLAKVENQSAPFNLSDKVNNTTWGELGLWSPSSSGLCTNAKMSPVSFGVNSFSGCLVKLTLADMANCSELRRTVLRNQQGLIKATHIAKKGNAVLNESKDWVPFIWPPLSSLSLSNITTNQTWNGTFGICDSIPAGVHYELLVKDFGNYQGQVQKAIVGARVRLSLRSWSFQCIGHNCQNCSLTRVNDTTICKDSIQSFEVTSSVAFITINEQKMTRQKRSADISNICYQDTCAGEIFYPLTTSFDGEKREVAVAYGLMLVAFLLLMLTLTSL